LTDPSRSEAGKWSGDPNHYYYVVSAILRERRDHPIGRSIGIINCGLDAACAENNLAQREFVFSLLSASDIGRGYASVPAPYLLINVSELTAEPVHPALTIVSGSHPSGAH
jgi:hypothetical protein